MKKNKKKVRKKHQERFSFKQEYKESWNYLKKAKNYIYFIFGVFLFFALLGFFIPLPESLANSLLELIQELIERTKGLEQGELIKFIFVNNLKTSFLGMIFGVFFGIFSILVAITNGYLVGFVASLVVQSEGISVLWKLFPHGIFELPAVFISLGLGLKFGTFIFQKNQKKAFYEYLWNSIRIFLLIVIPFLIIAAIIEGSLIAFGS